MIYQIAILRSNKVPDSLEDGSILSVLTCPLAFNQPTIDPTAILLTVLCTPTSLCVWPRPVSTTCIYIWVKIYRA